MTCDFRTYSDHILMLVCLSCADVKLTEPAPTVLVTHATTAVAISLPPALPVKIIRVAPSVVPAVTSTNTQGVSCLTYM